MREIEPRPISSYCDIRSSKRVFARDYCESGVPFYRGKEIIEKYKGALNVSTTLFISEEKFAELCAKLGAPQPGDLLLTSVGTLGIPYVVSPGERFYFKDGNLTWFYNFHGLDSTYLYYWLVSPTGKAELAKATIGSSQPAFTIVLLKDMQIACPPLHIQRKIASILSAYDDLIENNTRRIAILEDMAQAIYREWFVNFRFPGHENVKLVDSQLGQIPEGWEVLPFTDIADILSGGTPKTTNSDYWNGDIPFFTPRDCPDGFFVLSTARSVTEKGVNNCSSANFPERSIFITARGTVGKTILTPCNMAMSQSCYAVKPKALPHEFIFLMLRSSVEELKTRTHGAVFDTIIKDTFKQIQIALSPDEVALPFVKSVKPMFDAILVLYKKNQLLRSTRDLLLPKLISGKLDVEDLDIDVGMTTEALEEAAA